MLHDASMANIQVILLPGMDGTGELLADLAHALSRERQVHIISYPVDERLGYKELTGYVLERLPLNEPFVILGESFSGPIAIEIAAARPVQLKGLVLAASFARHPLPQFLAPFLSLLGVKWLPGNIIAAMLLGKSGTPELKTRLLEILAKLPEATLKHRAGEALRVNKLNRLCEITVPILCLHGRFDRLIGRRSVNEIASAKPDCRIIWLDAAHMLLETHPYEAAEAISKFCNDLAD